MGQEQGKLGGTVQVVKRSSGDSSTGACRWKRHPTGEVKRGAAPGCDLLGWISAEQELKLICLYFVQLQFPINILFKKNNLNALNN